MASHPRYRFSWRKGNRFDILVDSNTFFPRMLEAIREAKHTILLEMYLVRPGKVADRFIDALRGAAERGVRVYLLLDDFGTHELTPREHGRLLHDNIQVVYYNPLPDYSLIYNLYRIFWKHTTRGLYRDHRKLLLVDDTLAFSGGAGITDEVDSPGLPERRWRETMVQIRGPVIADWRQLFLDSWNRYADTPLQLSTEIPSPFDNGQAGRVTVNKARQRTGVQRSLIKHIREAREQVWFATAYFIPSRNIRRALALAAENGIDVRLLLPGPVTDHPGARHAGWRYYGRLLKNGVRIFEYMPRFFHAKTVLCDSWVTIGSCNYDRWNLQWNLEANQEVDDPETAISITGIFREDFRNCREVTLEDWESRSPLQRAKEWFWRRFELLSLKIRQKRKH